MLSCFMTTPTSPSLKDLSVGDLAHELATTRRVLERLPGEHLTWKPHEKSMSLGALAAHIANLAFWQRGILQSDEFNFADAPPPPQGVPESRDEILRTFDENAAALQSALEETGEEALGRTWTLRRGEQVMMSRPKAAALRNMGISHMIHHRGQLSVYLRLLDVPVPPMYGPTADERSF